MENSQFRPFELDQSMYQDYSPPITVLGTNKQTLQLFQYPPSSSQPQVVVQKSKNQPSQKEYKILSQYQFSLNLQRHSLKVSLTADEKIKFVITAEQSWQSYQNLSIAQNYHKISLSQDQFTHKLKQYLQTPRKMFVYLKGDPSKRIVSFNQQIQTLTFMVFKCLTTQFIDLKVPEFTLSKEQILEKRVQILRQQNNQLRDQLLVKQLQMGKCKEELYHARIKLNESQGKIAALNQQLIATSSLSAGQINQPPKLQKVVSDIFSENTGSSDSKISVMNVTKQHQPYKKSSERKHFLSLSSETIIQNSRQRQDSFLSNEDSLFLSKLSGKSSSLKQSQNLIVMHERINHFSHLKKYLQKHPLLPLEKIIAKKQLQGTKTIFLQNLKIKCIPPFPDLIGLQTLAMENNEIQKIQNLWQLQNLQNLSLFHNKITKIEGLEHLHILKTLNLAKNEIRSIQNISRLRLLQKLYLDQNKIKSLSQQLYELKKLQVLKIKNNRINWKSDDSRHVKILKKLQQNNVRIEFK